jgi:hypothetical protein
MSEDVVDRCESGRSKKVDKKIDGKSGEDGKTEGGGRMYDLNDCQYWRQEGSDDGWKM